MEIYTTVYPCSRSGNGSMGNSRGGVNDTAMISDDRRTIADIRLPATDAGAGAESGADVDRRTILRSGLKTVAEFSDRAHSSPTVLRFVAKLGCLGYPDFQRALQRRTGSSAALRHCQAGARAPSGSPLAHY